jgi:hypothetical protein
MDGDKEKNKSNGWLKSEWEEQSEKQSEKK